SDFDCDSKKFNPLPTNKDDMIDWQFITLQEKPEDLPPGSSPKAIPCRLVYDLVNAVRPGDRVTLTGVIRSRETKLKKRGQVLTFDNWVDVNYVQSISKEDELTKITPAEEQEFLDMAEDPQIFDHLVDSLAPQIHKMDRIKQAALLMLFAGVDKSHPDGFSTRGQPNILLVGDPGVAKSQLLRYVQSIAPRGLYTSGKGSSAAGLTAAIIRDPETGEITLEAGAMVLADRGVCLIDEFDKMNENDRSAIHEAMEQHTVSVAKAGIVATLNARTGVLAAANPKHGRYEDYRPFNENVNLSPAILSRFDLVFIMRDIPEEKDDEQLASHILKLHRFHGSSDSRRPPLNEEKLRKYIAFAKKQFNPIITEPAAEKIQHYYVNMRNSYGAVGENPKDRITITARQLEGIIRLAESHARARLKENVTEEDADFAIDLMKYSLDQITLDPESGEYDYDAFISGQTKTRRSKLNMVRDAINFMHKDAGGSFNEEETIQFAMKESGDTLTDEYVRGAIEQMIRDGQLYRPNRGKLDKP
ncbi:MAG: ATP-binding protein, partial [Candidatus Kariarchaeaceae archaeon]